MGRIIVGRQPVVEALRAGTQIEKILVLQGVHGRIVQEIRSLAQDKDVPVVEIGRQEFRESASDATTQGVIAVIATQQQYVELEDLLSIPTGRNQRGFLLILDEIEDPHNLGALIRTAECAGVHGVIIPKHHSASVTSAVAKASAGAVEHMAIAEVTNVSNAIGRLKENGYWIVGLDAVGDKLYTGVDYKTPTALIVGSEGKGIRRLVKEHCDFLVKIPLHGKIESLNASVAGGLVMFEVAKQRTTN
ncbi:MAG TPA: 23S rRNA (guanosine(2251)-2'-O)-methyltransferase RlmB [Bacteroidetes bacterium]|jgi:23S rRNA (guanosine2251-2'-O)-methyltransferase|nr:23S rRNA (guanosine(2251)-2'-O)-methyltransferase RlmB [Bacteroidota bacterium]